MSYDPQQTVGSKLRRLFIGKEKNLGDKHIFHSLSLAAFLAWVGLGADGLSSSCYGPYEAFVALGSHSILAVIVGLMSVVTVFVIAASYSQIIELFPDGGGGYFVASKLLSPKLGMFSGCALMIDYVLTITLSIASGADAILSMFPNANHELKVPLAVAGILIITTLNLRGVKESIKVLVPIFLTFVVTHAFSIIYAIITHAYRAPVVAERMVADAQSTYAELGTMGLLFLLLRAYSMGAGTYTGIEAVSNGMPMLREPRVQTGKRTMMLMAFSLSITVLGLMVSYVLFNIRVEEGRTLNATLFTSMTADWPTAVGSTFVIVTLASEALLLFVAAQTGFLDGPRIMANMALDRWLPSRFSSLSDRLVSQNGVLCFSGAALVLMVLSQGNVSHLVVLYSINVFITFVLSQAGMVRHWWQTRKENSHWLHKISVNCIGLLMSVTILVSIIIIKFDEGAWITLVVTGLLVVVALFINRHYREVGMMIRKLNPLVARTEQFGLPLDTRTANPDDFSRMDRTAVILVGGYNGLGMQSLWSFLSYHGRSFNNILFIQIGVVDTNVFRHSEMLDNLKDRLQSESNKYVSLVQKYGFHSEGIWAVGTDVVEEVMKLAPAIKEDYPKSVFFGGQIMFKEDRLFERILHNYQGFSLQRNLFRLGIPFEMIPISIEDEQVPLVEEEK